MTSLRDATHSHIEVVSTEQVPFPFMLLTFAQTWRHHNVCAQILSEIASAQFAFWQVENNHPVLKAISQRRL